MGLGYSTFMNGSIVLEQDFVQQFYTFGPVGVVLVCGPWIVLTLACVVMLLRQFKDHFNLENGVYALALALGFGSGYMSGHVLDQFITSLFMAMIMAMLLTRMGAKHE